MSFLISSRQNVFTTHSCGSKWLEGGIVGCTESWGGRLLAVPSCSLRLGGATKQAASLALFQGHKACGHHMQGIGPFQCWELSPVGREARRNWRLASARVRGGREGAQGPRV